ncbi:MAG TPA: hypothetical protein VNI57_14735, partial [Candidatus Saccharimonadales bacterium]|nr:hypothetical protein [Candidatus Saccharimonadales bacterium]
YANAVKAYFQGDYDAAVPGLESAGDTIENDPEIPAMLGAALYKKYILTRSTDEALKDQAGEAFRSALAIRPGFTLDPKFYPPKVIAFFRQVAAGAAPGS